MRLANKNTGDILEIPPPDTNGESVLLLNGVLLERVLFSDKDGGSATIGDGTMFRAGEEFANYCIKRLADASGEKTEAPRG